MRLHCSLVYMNCGGFFERPGDVADGLSGLPPLPQLLLASRTQPSWTIQSRHSRTPDPDNTQDLPCCTDRLNPLTSITMSPDRYSLWIPSMGKHAVDCIRETLG